MSGEAAALATETVAAVLSACAGQDALAARLQRALAPLRAGLGARAAAVGLLLPDGVWLLARDGAVGESELRDGAALELVGRWRLWLAPPEAGRGGPLLGLLAHVLRRELERELLAERASQDAALRAAITHELGNALTPLLCHSAEPVARDSTRLRLLLDLLRQVDGGSGGPPALLDLGGLVERVRRVAHKLPGPGWLRVEVEPQAAPRALGCEARELFPLLLRALAGLRAQGTVHLRGLLDGGAPRVELEAEHQAPPVLALDLPEVRGARLARDLLPGRVRLVVTPTQPARAVVVCAEELLPRLSRGLAPLGLVLSRARDAAEAARLLEEPPTPWAVLIDDASQAEAHGLRRLILERRLGSRAQPPLVVLGPDLRPQAPAASPDEVDLGRLLAG